MKGEELKTFFTNGANWDGITGAFKTDEIDENSVRKFLRMAAKTDRLRAADENEGIESILNKLKLIVDGKLTNAAIMLFGKEPQKYFTNAKVRVGRLKNETTIVSDRLIEGNLFTQALEAEEAIKNCIGVDLPTIDFDLFSIDIELPNIDVELLNTKSVLRTPNRCSDHRISPSNQHLRDFGIFRKEKKSKTSFFAG